MTIELEVYFENGLFGIYAGGYGDSGITVTGATAEECAESFQDYLENYLEEAKTDENLHQLMKKTTDHNGHIDLSDKDIMFYDCDTEDQEGEAFKVLGVTLKDHANLVVEVDCDGNTKWDADDLSAYEVQLLLDEIE